MQINFARNEINCKIVYYGPGMSGKTTNLEKVYEKLPGNSKGKFTSIATEGDRTLYFDFLPVDVGKIGGLDVKLQVYTVPGQVYYDATRKLVLRGVDGIIFVADSQKGRMTDNAESLENLRTHLKDYGRSLEEIPLVFQYNKRDLPDVCDMQEMRQRLNVMGKPDFEGRARDGIGVLDALRECSKSVIREISKEMSAIPAAASAVPAAAAKQTQPDQASARPGTLPSDRGVIGRRPYSQAGAPATAGGASVSARQSMTRPPYVRPPRPVRPTAAPARPIPTYSSSVSRSWKGKATQAPVGASNKYLYAIIAALAGLAGGGLVFALLKFLD